MKGTQNFFRRASGSDQSKTMSAARAFSALIFLAICQVLYFPVFSSASDGAPSSRQTGLRDDWHVTAGEALSPGIADMAADSLFWQGDTLTLREVTISASFNIDQIQGAETIGKLTPVGNEINEMDPIFGMKVRIDIVVSSLPCISVTMYNLTRR